MNKIEKHLGRQKNFMPRKTSVQKSSPPNVMILGVGSFAHSIGTALADAGAKVSTYLTRNYGHFPPTLVGPTYTPRASQPRPVAQAKRRGGRHPAVHRLGVAAVGGGFAAIRGRHFQPHPRGDAHRARARFCPEIVRRFQNSLSTGLCRGQSGRGGKNSGEASATVRHQKPALLADQSDPHDFVRDDRRHARVAAARQLCRRGFPAGIPGPRRGRPHCPGERR